MTDAMQTIRDKLVKIINNNVYHTLAARTFAGELVDSKTIIRPDGKLAQEALTALGSLAGAPSEQAILEARKFAEKIAGLYISFGLSDYYKQAAALIQAHDERIRRECADRAEKYGRKYLGEPLFPAGLRAAILSAKPAQDDGKACRTCGKQCPNDCPMDKEAGE